LEAFSSGHPFYLPFGSRVGLTIPCNLLLICLEGKKKINQRKEQIKIFLISQNEI
jgi:hypothetical protein